MVLHSDDLSSSGSSTGQNSGGIQGLDGERVNHTNVLPCELIRKKRYYDKMSIRPYHLNKQLMTPAFISRI